MRTNNRLSYAAIAILALPLAGNAQNNSYAHMLTTTSTLTNNFTTMQRQYLGNISNAAKAYGAQSTPGQPAQPQFPITATDFRGAASREFPERMASAMAGLTPEQKAALETLYNQLLTEFEKTNRPNNIAAAVGYGYRISLEIVRGRTLSPAETDAAIQYFNNILALSSEFQAMTQTQKQTLYEGLILTSGMAAVLYVQGLDQNNPAMQMQGRQIAQSVLQQWTGARQ